MKKLFFAALLAISVATSAFAAGTNVNASVLRNFKMDFKNATNISWTAAEDYAKATFTVNNVKTEAFYNAEGELIGTSKNIELDELPVNAKRTFAKKFDGYTVKEVIHFEGSNESAYYLSAENNTEAVIFKVGENEQLTTYKKTKK